MSDGATSDPGALTAVERRGGVWLKRDDLFEIAGVRGGKARACYLLARAASEGLVTASARQSPQASIVARIARHLGLPCRVHTPSGSPTPELEDALQQGAERIAHPAGYNRVIIARAREDGWRRGWTVIPFGMECWEAVRCAAHQTANLPRGAKRLIVPVGSGMTLSGVLVGLERRGRSLPVFGVVVGADPRKRLDRWAPPDWRKQATLVRSPLPYHRPAPETELTGLALDPTYEAKCLPFLEQRDCFWIVGVRRTLPDAG